MTAEVQREAAAPRHSERKKRSTSQNKGWRHMEGLSVCVSVCVCSVGHLELICVLLSLFPCQASGQFLQVKLKLVQADVGIFSGSEG